MSACVFEHPFLGSLLGDEEIASYFSAAADLRQMLDFEAVLAESQAAEGLIGEDEAGRIAARCAGLEPDRALLNEATARDGVAVPELLRQIRAGLDSEAAEALHKGATSQDAIEASLATRLHGASLAIDARLEQLVAAFAEWSAESGEKPVMAHTRMQAARRTRFSRKLASWRDPLLACRRMREEIAPRVFVLRFGGAVGDRAELGDRGQAVAERVAAALSLHAAPTSLHSERGGIAEFGGWLSLITGALGKFGQDAALALQSEVGELSLSGGGTSSAMAHKNNPVGAEVLVALARFNATLLSGLHHSLVHENERSGAAWTLEWMILPQMVMAAGASMRTALDLVERLSLAEDRDLQPVSRP